MTAHIIYIANWRRAMNVPDCCRRLPLLFCFRSRFAESTNTATRAPN